MIFKRFLYLMITFTTMFSFNDLIADATFKSETQSFEKGEWIDRAKELKVVIDETLKYLEKGSTYDPSVIHGGRWSGAPNIEKVKATLKFMSKVIDEDIKLGVKSRLFDPDFLKTSFDLVRWLPDVVEAKKLAPKKPLLNEVTDEKILMTKYYVKLAQGSFTKTSNKKYAIYGLPFDEANLSLEEAELVKSKLTRYKFGKQSILKGSLDAKKLAPPLVWLSREDLEGALLQGTVVVKLGKIEKVYNVHRSNEIAYDRSLKPNEQERYWYFQEVDGVKGYGKDADYKISVLPEVTVAGDVEYFGLGKIFLLGTVENKKLTYRLTVLADTGGAFKNNLYQLDWLSGFYSGWGDYHKSNKQIADSCKAWMLILK